MSDTIACSNCGNAFAQGDRFCPKCGTEATMGTVTSPEAEERAEETNATVCPKCSAPMGRDDRFCPKCGTERQEEATVVSSVSLRNAQAQQLQIATEGKFEVLEQLGLGAMGSVYLADDVALGRKCAIKVIASNLLEDETMVARFRREAQIVASLRHPSIVNVHTVGHSEDLYYFVMDYIDGPPLRTIVKAHPHGLEIPVVQAILYQVGSALDYAHRRGGVPLIHRDIKPANIMLDLEGHAYVTDFGIAKDTGSKGLTMTDGTIGTPDYMSPEQCRGEDLTGASDQYSLGVVAYEMITGRTPFTGGMMVVMMAHNQEEPAPIKELRPDCPDHVAEAVHKMLAKAVEDRWPDLESAVGHMGGKPMGYKDPVRQRIIDLISGDVSDAATVVMPTAPSAAAGPAGVSGAASAAPPSTPAPAPPQPTADTATSVSVIGLPTSVEVGDSFTLAADVRGATQGSLPGIPVDWSSTDPSVARVTNGHVQALKAGTAVITATAGEITNSVSVLVAEAAPVAVLVDPDTAHVSSGQRVSLSARVQDRSGRDLDRTIRWLTSDAGVASVTRTGEVIATGTGIATITAESGGVTGTAEVVVQGTGKYVPVRPPAKKPFYKSPAAIGGGVLVAGLAGVGYAFSQGLIGGGGPAPVDDVVDAVEISGVPATLAVGDSVQVVATPVDENGDALTRDITWEADGANARVGESGWVVALAAGPVSIRALADGVAGSASLEVTAQMAEGPSPGGGDPPGGGDEPAGGDPPPDASATEPASIRIAVARTTLTAGESVTVGATVTARNGSALASRSGDVRWSSNNPAVLSIDPSGGTARAVSAGNATLIASLGDVRQTVPITVQAAQAEDDPGPSLPTPADLDLRVPSTLQLGQTEPFSVQIRDDRGGALNQLLSQVEVRSTNTDVISVDVAAGTLEALAAGSTEIEARLGPLSRRLPVTVEAPITAVAIQGGNVSLEEGGTGRVSAQVQGPGGIPLPGQVVRWSSDNTAVVTVDASSGALRAVGAGSATVTATAGDQSDAVTVTVAAAGPSLPSAGDVPGLLRPFIDALNSGDRDAANGFADGDLGDVVGWIGSNNYSAALEGSPGAPSLQGATPVARFQLRISRRRNFGGDQSETRDLIARFQAAGSGWRLASVAPAG